MTYEAENHPLPSRHLLGIASADDFPASIGSNVSRFKPTSLFFEDSSLMHTAAVLITSSNLIASDLSPKIWGIPAIGLIGLAWGVWMGLRHALSTRRSDGL